MALIVFFSSKLLQDGRGALPENPLDRLLVRKDLRRVGLRRVEIRDVCSLDHSKVMVVERKRKGAMWTAGGLILSLS